MSSMGRIETSAERRAASRAPLAAMSAAGVRARLRPARLALADLAGEWDDLVLRAAEPNPFHERWFVAASLAHLAGDRDIRLAEVRRGARLIGLLPLTIERGYAHLPVRFVQNWYHDHAFLGSPLVAAGEEAAFWEALLGLLDRDDWAGAFLHLRGLAEDGPLFRALGRGEVVHRRRRAMLDTRLDPGAYFELAVRGKKRKELRRQRSRLGELGDLGFRRLAEGSELSAWCDDYLALERKGWKGKAGTGLAVDAAAEAFFRAAAAGAWEAGRLQFLRLDLDGRAIAMLANFLTPPGGFSFKTAFDEDYGRFSPGVLLQIENLRILEDPDIEWVDSCAMDHHSMIDGLWRERRSVVRVTIPLKGARRRAVHALCRGLERASALVKGQRP
ncbi:MAG: GNAT family N-acetyltransferase [Alphaproteobacteria bacterium]|nr:MAG: GNAT family N-acetyltransferase [Alphaproteobacteria bacterium]